MTMEKYDPAKIMDAVTDRIKAEFVALIPGDQWKSMVKKEIEVFFSESSTYGRRNFTQVVNETLTLEARKRVSDYLNSPGWSTQWGERGEPLASQNIEELVVKVMPQIQKAIFAEMAQHIVDHSLQHLRVT